jgi:hypothetical protein
VFEIGPIEKVARGFEHESVVDSDEPNSWFVYQEGCPRRVIDVSITSCVGGSWGYAQIIGAESGKV